MTRFFAAGGLNYKKIVGRCSSSLLALLCLGLQVLAQAPLSSAPPHETRRDNSPPTKAVKFIAPKFLTMGKTVRGRDITAMVYGSGAKRVLIFGGIHGDEQNTTVVARALAVNMNTETLPPNLTVVIVPDVNPDGLMVSTRVNANGVDINRNFPSKTWRAEYIEQRHYPGVKPSSEPETRAVLSLLESYPPHLVVTLHAALGCVNWDGQQGAPLAQTLASVNGYPLCASLGYETPGSLGILTGIDKQIPTVTIELRAKNASALVGENLPALLALLKSFASK
jgi:murein peptide amidase A